MSFAPEKLAIITSAQGFTLWRYTTREDSRTLLAPAYFAPAAGMLRRGDLIFVSHGLTGDPKTGLLLVSGARDGEVIVESVANVAPEAFAALGSVAIDRAEVGDVLTFVNGVWTNMQNPGANGDTHATVSGNPHGATAADVGAIPAAAMGQPGGVATLDGDGRLSAPEARTLSLDELRDVAATNPRIGDIIKFDGLNWKAGQEAGASGDAFAVSHPGTGGSAHATATTTQAGFLAAADKAKLDGIQAGAQVNAVTSVAGKTGAVALTKGDVGLNSVANAAQLTRGAADWASFPVKSAPAPADRLLIEDSASAGEKKTITIGTLPSSGGGGEANTASNVNTAGIGVFKQKTGINLEFRGVKAGSARVSVASTDTDTCIGIDVAEQHLRLDNIGGSLKDGGAHGTQGGGSLHAVATSSSAGFMTPQDKAKLDGIEAGAQVNRVTSVVGKTGAVTLSADDIADGSANRTFSAAEKSKLASVETGATADQTGAEIVEAINSELGGTGWQQAGSASVSSRAITAPLSDDSAISLELPGAVHRRDFLLGFTATGAVTTTKVATAKDVDDLAARGLSTVDTIAALRQSNPRSAGAAVLLRGYHKPGDGGGGTFVWDAASTATHDGGLVIQVSGVSTGRWLRQFNDRVNVKWFGAKGDNTADDWAAIQAAVNSGRPLYFSAGTYLITASIILPQSIPVNWLGDSMEASVIADNRTGSSPEPLIRHEAPYPDYDGNWINPPSYWDGGILSEYVEIREMKFVVKDTNPNGHVMYLYNPKGAVIHSCKFGGFRARGLTFASGFDTLVSRCTFAGMTNDPVLYQNEGATHANRREVGRKTWGLMSSGHGAVIGCYAVGCGTGFRVNGHGNFYSACRAEVNIIGYSLGEDGPAFHPVSPSFLSGGGSTFSSTISGCTSELNCIGVLVRNAGYSTVIDGVSILGSIYPDRWSDYGLVVGSADESVRFSNISIFGNFKISGHHNAARTAAVFTNVVCKGVGGGGASMSAAAAITSQGATVNEDAAYHFIGTAMRHPRPSTGSLPYKPARTATAFHDLMLRGLTGLNLRDRGSSGSSQEGFVFAKNFGGTVTPASGASSAAVTFMTQRFIHNSGLSDIQLIEDPNSLLAPGTYYYANCCVTKIGEHSVQPPHNEASITVPGGSTKYKVRLKAWFDEYSYRRIYRRTSNGVYLGYWQRTPSDPLTFEDNGREAFYDLSPPVIGVTLGPGTQVEDDANYQIVAMPSWNTSVWVTNKATTGFSLNFSTPVPDGNQTVAWLMFRP